MNSKTRKSTSHKKHSVGSLPALPLRLEVFTNAGSKYNAKMCACFCGIILILVEGVPKRVGPRNERHFWWRDHAQRALAAYQSISRLAMLGCLKCQDYPNSQNYTIPQDCQIVRFNRLPATSLRTIRKPFHYSVRRNLDLIFRCTWVLNGRSELDTALCPRSLWMENKFDTLCILIEQSIKLDGLRGNCMKKGINMNTLQGYLRYFIIKSNNQKTRHSARALIIS